MRCLWPVLLIALALTAVALLIAPLATQAQGEASRLHVQIASFVDDRYPTITMQVNISDDDALNLYNLNRDNFMVTIDNQPVDGLQVTAVSPQPTPLNLVVAIDKSILTDTEKSWQQLKDLAGLVHNALGAQDRLSMVVFSEKVTVADSLDGVAPDQTYTALHRAIETAVNKAADLRRQNGENSRAVAIIITDRPENTWRLPEPPPTLENLRSRLVVTESAPVELHIWGYGAMKDIAGPDYIGQLQRLAVDIKGEAAFPTDLTAVRHLLLQQFNQWRPTLTHYTLQFQSLHPVGQPHRVRVTVNHAGRRSATTDYQFTAAQQDFAVEVRGIPAAGQPLLPTNGLTLTVAAPKARYGPFYLQYWLQNNQVSPSTIFSLEKPEALIQLTNLSMGNVYTFHVVLTDTLGNSGSATAEFALAQNIRVALHSANPHPVTQNLTLTAVFSVEALAGQYPITLTLHHTDTILGLGSLSLQTDKPEALIFDFRKLIARRATPQTIASPACWPARPPVSMCIRQEITEWWHWPPANKAATLLPEPTTGDSAIPGCSAALTTIGRCVGGATQQVWTRLTAAAVSTTTQPITVSLSYTSACATVWPSVQQCVAQTLPERQAVGLAGQDAITETHLAPISCSPDWSAMQQCIVKKERALWQAFTTPLQQQAPLTEMIELSAVDSLGQQLNPSITVTVPVHFTPITRADLLQPHHRVLWANGLVGGALLLLAWWLWRRYVTAHSARYQLLLRNTGNVPCRYRVWAIQPDLLFRKSPQELGYQSSLLRFTFYDKAGRPLPFLGSGQSIRPVRIKSGTSSSAVDLAAAPAIAATAQHIDGAPFPDPAFALLESLGPLPNENPHQIILGDLRWVETIEVQPNEALPLEVRIQPQQRHWQRQDYRFIIYSEPLSYGANWRHPSTVETIRFGGLATPIRLDTRSAATPTAPSTAS